MGVVYRAVDTRLGRPVALKMLLAEATADVARRARFIQEARSASALNHPHIVTIYDVDEHDGATFIAMELVDGRALDQVLRGGALSIGDALKYALHVASALGAAHDSGIIHRDVKPANIVITRDGRAKVLDFGLAKLAERMGNDATMTGVGTQPGIILGTAAYMSPEQAQGHIVDARSDIFSFGAVLYEMLAGRRPFAGDSEIGLITAILRDQPAPLKAIRADLPAALQSIVDRCLAKDPAARFADAHELTRALEAVQASLAGAAPSRVRGAVLVPIVLVLIAAAVFAGWQTVQARRARWVREQLVEIDRLMETTKSGVAVIRLARDTEPYAPEDIARLRQRLYPLVIDTQPAGAEIQLKDYGDPAGAWESVGRSPLRNVAVPIGLYRVRITLEGHEPTEFSVSAAGTNPRRLWVAGSVPPGMVFVEGGSYQIGVATPVTLPDFWIDRSEVSNQEFKRFVDAGGYRDPRYWKVPFTTAAGTVTFEDAMARFRDATGRTGPATWELGSYPEGRADHPVGGISWFEAAAFAEFTGKTLPTIYHWNRASGADGLFSDVLRFSNFDGKGTSPSGQRAGLGPWGTLDMAGNVKEWCSNEIQGAALRYVLGGAWNEPAYRFRDEEARDPWERGETLGVRLVRNLGEVTALAVAPLQRVHADPATIVAVGDTEFAVLKGFYAYDRTPLDARVERVDDSSPHYRQEVVSYTAAYGGERIRAHLFLPKNARPPYQTVLYFPNSYARQSSSSDYLDHASFEFVVRSGRALLYPVYKGPFERGGGGPLLGRIALRDMQVAWGKDVFRSVDYLQSRPDVLNIGQLAYHSMSMGAFYGPIPVALEPRLKSAIFAAGGLRSTAPPETLPTNFLPRVTVPVLLVNGRDDFSAPVGAQKRFMELLGTPPEHRRHTMLEGGHVPNDWRGLIREVLDFLDKYQPVGNGQ